MREEGGVDLTSAVECPGCLGEKTAGCPVCGGNGFVEIDLDEPDPEWWPVAGPVLEALGLVERMGYAAWRERTLAEDGREHAEIAAEFFEAVMFVESEIDRIAHERRVEKARSKRKR